MSVLHERWVICQCKSLVSFTFGCALNSCSFAVDSEGNKFGQIPRVAFRPDLQTSSNLETIYLGCSCDMGGVYCQLPHALLEPLDNPLVRLHHDITVLSCHDFRLHHHLFHSSPASNPATGQFAAKLRHSCTRPEHNEIQGSCVTFPVGASDVMRLLPAIFSQ